MAGWRIWRGPAAGRGVSKASLDKGAARAVASVFDGWVCLHRHEFAIAACFVARVGPDVAAAAEAVLLAPDLHASLPRERAPLTKPEACQMCHAMINPLAFRWNISTRRAPQTRKGRPIDAGGARRAIAALSGSPASRWPSTSRKREQSGVRR